MWLQERKCPDEYGKADRRGDDGKPSQPSVDELARAVIAGRYGVGEARRKALGSRYAEVQRRVNQLLP